MGRAPCCDKTSVKRGPWSPEEDELLRSYVQRHGTGGNWIALPQKAGLNRCGKSCRLRWLNYLRPDIKHGGYTEQEDHIICSLYNSIGSRWSIIASKLPGRTDNDVKNYWNTKLKKKAIVMQHQQQHGGGRGHRDSLIAPPPAPQSQCASMQPSPVSTSPAVTTASGEACFAMYSPPQALTHYDAPPPQPVPLLVPPAVPVDYSSDNWGNGMTLDEVFLSELVGGGDGEFPQGDVFGGFGLQLQDRALELSACYFPNMQAEIWASSDHAKPQGLCHSLT